MSNTNLLNFILIHYTRFNILFNCIFLKSQEIQSGLEKIEESTLELGRINDTLLQQDLSIIQKNETCQHLIKQINGTRILIEEMKSVVNNCTEKLNLKNEQIINTKKQMKELIDKTLPVLSTTRNLLNEINSDDLTELK